MAWLHYLWQVSVCLAAFYAIYLLLLHRLTFFAWNRAYLLLALLTSWIIPLVRISLPSTESTSLWWLNELRPSPVAAPELTNSPWPLVENGLLGIYFTGTAWMLARLGYSVWKIRQRIRKAPAERQESYRIIPQTGKTANASFFHIVFLDTENLSLTDQTQVLAHEKHHIRRRHSWDVLATEISKTLLWFNPVIYFYQRSLQLVHEFEADWYATQENSRHAYAQLLLKLHGETPLPFMQSFGHPPVSQRIHRLFHPKSSVMKKFTYALFVPVLIAGMSVFSCHKEMAVAPAESNKLAKALIIVDGKEESSKYLSNLNPERIERMEVLKDKTAIERYGKKGKNGVVIVTTKKTSSTIHYKPFLPVTLAGYKPEDNC